MNNWYALEKLARIRQEEILHDAQNARIFPINLGAALANHKLAVVVGAAIALTFIAIGLAIWPA